jgi:rod shape-determining protein MreD
MRWPTFIVLGILAVALQTSALHELVTLKALGDLSPNLLAVLAVFIALFAPRATALWAAWILGLMLDLCQLDRLLVGPYALGFVLGTFIVLQLRTMVFRRRVLTLALLTLICLVAAAVVEVTLHTVRSWYPQAPPAWSDYRPLGRLLYLLAAAVYAALLAIPLGWLLHKTFPLWGFHQVVERRRIARMISSRSD